MSMTSKERVAMAIAHEEPGRGPIRATYTSETEAKLRGEIPPGRGSGRCHRQRYGEDCLGAGKQLLLQGHARVRLPIRHYMAQCGK